jgi:cyclin-dependent kinase
MIAYSNRLLGTPTEDDWPGVTQLPDYKSSFPQWKAKDVRTAVTGLDDISADLLEVSTNSPF